MAVIEIRPPSSRDLKWFGLFLLIACAAIGGLLRSQWGFPGAATIVWGAGAAVASIYYLVPAMQRPLYMTWMYTAFPIGWVVSHVLLAAIFYCVMTPIGLLVRHVSHDPLLRQFDRSVDTYWVRREARETVNRYFKQF